MVLKLEGGSKAGEKEKCKMPWFEWHRRTGGRQRGFERKSHRRLEAVPKSLCSQQQNWSFNTRAAPVDDDIHIPSAGGGSQPFSKSVRGGDIGVTHHVQCNAKVE